MGVTRYWSVEECRWVDWPGSETPPAELTVPQQRAEKAAEPAQEPVDA